MRSHPAVLIPPGSIPPDLRSADGDVLMLAVPVHGRHTAVRACRDAAARHDHPSGLPDGDTAVLLVPWAALPISPRALPARACGLSIDLPTGAVLTEVVSALVRQEVRPTGAHVAGLLTDLAATLLTELTDHQPSGPESVLLDEVRWHINTSLGDTRLSPPDLAAEHHISVRQLHKLFAASGTTPGRWVLRRRLEESARELARTGPSERKIAATATRWGFASAAHFSRAFRDAFGVAPHEWRATRAELVLHGPGGDRPA
ncbi:helix-turn-helix transcriptional regulator [Kitasatospora sp. NPDC048365]|uniref:helix-turn-helix transcriptional regulator n=1 Tax=Kitasatospora sp. NPDC048365 TaxID=3364050 RepID=UPI0037220136